MEEGWGHECYDSAINTVSGEGWGNECLPCFTSARLALVIVSNQQSDFDLSLSLSPQSSRINDQRCFDPTIYRKSTMPSEDFFNLILHLQSTRIEDQRSPLPLMAAN